MFGKLFFLGSVNWLKYYATDDIHITQTVMSSWKTEQSERDRESSLCVISHASLIVNHMLKLYRDDSAELLDLVGEKKAK